MHVKGRGFLGEADSEESAGKKGNTRSSIRLCVHGSILCEA